MITNIKEEMFNVKDINLKKSVLDNIQKMFEKEAVYFLRNNFDLNLDIPIEINARLTRTHGYFSHTQKKALKISMSKKFISSAVLMGEIDAVIDTLRHELVHYALFKLGKKYSDGDYEFENKLKELNIGASGMTNSSKVVTRKASRYSELTPQYHCSKCGKNYFVKSGLTTNRIYVNCSGCDCPRYVEQTGKLKIKFYDYTHKNY